MTHIPAWNRHVVGWPGITQADIDAHNARMLAERPTEIERWAIAMVASRSILDRARRDLPMARQGFVSFGVGYRVATIPMARRHILERLRQARESLARNEAALAVVVASMALAAE